MLDQPGWLKDKGPMKRYLCSIAPHVDAKVLRATIGVRKHVVLSYYGIPGILLPLSSYENTSSSLESLDGTFT